MPEIWYPGASRTQDRSSLSGITMSRINKLLLHSTEGSGWPGYPTFSPQLTYDPWKHAWRQHMAITRSATTLADPSSTAVRENRDDVVQVEIVGYCDPAQSKKYGHSIQDMDAAAYEDLAGLAAWLHTEYGLPLRSTVTWRPYPDSYGAKASQRLSGPEFDRYTGILGHQHASGNDHGDPGVIDAARIVRRALELTGFTPTPKGPIMTEAKPLYRNNTDWQDVAAGEHAIRIDEVAADGTKPYSLVIGDSDGVDLTASVEVKGLLAGETATVYFARIIASTAKTDTVVDHRWRSPGHALLVGRGDGNETVTADVRYAGDLGKNDPGYRLRVYITTPHPVQCRMLTRGWVIE